MTETAMKNAILGKWGIDVKINLRIFKKYCRMLIYYYTISTYLLVIN